MATSFDRWEKDPFFTAAEEVQESADRMESTYRTWIHASKDSSSFWDPEELRRDLRTTLGTTKWQLEEFGRAVKSSYVRSPNDDAVDRHREFIVAIENQVSNVEKSLQESSISEGKGGPLPWVRLDEGERDELALFLAGPPASNGKIPAKICGRNGEKQLVPDTESAQECSKNSARSAEWGSRESRQEKQVETEKVHGHRRTASACADIGVWKISVSDDDLTSSSSERLPVQPVRKIPSLSGFLSSMESTSKPNLPKNGFRKWKAMDIQQDNDTALLRPALTRGINVCYEKSKSCLESGDECCDKQLHGWYGALQRQFQRSQYHMQYSRPVQMTIWVAILLCLIVLVTLSVV